MVELFKKKGRENEVTIVQIDELEKPNGIELEFSRLNDGR